MPRPRVTARRRWADALMVLATLVFLLIGSITLLASYFMMWKDCPEAFDDEYDVAPPKSLQGRLMCSDDDVRGHYVALVLMAVLLVLAVVVWVRRRAVTITLVLLAAMSITPIPVALTMQALPQECTQGQWEKYGAEGCERNTT